MPKHRITIVNTLSRRVTYKAIRTGLEVLLATANLPPVSVSVLITDNDEMQEMNNRFRGIDEPTDVLSFPSPPEGLPYPGPKPLGDIAISIDFAEAQARIRKVRIQDELAMLAIHGGLHLLGMDDETEPERSKMVERMNEIAALAQIPTDADWSSLPHGGSD